MEFLKYTVLLIMGLFFSCGLNPADIMLTNTEQQSILFVQEPQVNSSGQSIMKRATQSNVDQFLPNTNIMHLYPIAPGGTLRNLTERHHKGVGAACDPEISPDGKRILFAMKLSSQRDHHWCIYEMDINGDNIIQLTNPIVGDDFDPAYLPNNKIVFTSTRPQIVDEYDRRQAPVLHIADRNGVSPTAVIPDKNIRQISFNQSHDLNPIVHSSGKIYYTRWEHLGDPNKLALFSINPDGTGLFLLYGSHTPSGNSSRVMLEAREMHDRGIITSVMTRNSPHAAGALGILDLSVVEGSVQFINGNEVTWNNTQHPSNALFKTPYPIMDEGQEKIIAAMSPTPSVNDNNAKADFGIYLIDPKTKKSQVIFNTPHLNEYDPIVVQRTTPTPQNIETNPDVQKALNEGYTRGTFFNSNAYLRQNDGQIITKKDTVMDDGIKGQARYYRILAAIPMPRERDLRGNPLGNTNLEKQKVLGYAPIYEDGSSSLELPANVAVHYQALDNYGLMLVNQKTWVQVMPGEKRMCVGCHGLHNDDLQIFNMSIDPVKQTVSNSALQVTYEAGFNNSVAIEKFTPNTQSPPPVLQDTLDFFRHDKSIVHTVQNVLNRNCLSCHDRATVSGGVVLEHTGLTEQKISIVYDYLTRQGIFKTPSGKEITYTTRRGARNSPLIWKMFNRQLDTGQNIDFTPAKDGSNSSSEHDHSQLWHKDSRGNIDVFHEKNRDLLTLIEWIDMGLQYSNSTGYKEEGAQ